MKELTKSLGAKQTRQAVPESVEGKVSHDDILEVFRENYSNLYNSASSLDTMAIIKDRLKELITENSQREVLKITGNVVKQACAVQG